MDVLVVRYRSRSASTAFHATVLLSRDLDEVRTMCCLFCLQPSVQSSVEGTIIVSRLQMSYRPAVCQAIKLGSTSRGICIQLLKDTAVSLKVDLTGYPVLRVTRAAN